METVIFARCRWRTTPYGLPVHNPLRTHSRGPMRKPVGTERLGELALLFIREAYTSINEGGDCKSPSNW